MYSLVSYPQRNSQYINAWYIYAEFHFAEVYYNNAVDWITCVNSVDVYLFS